MADGSKRGHKMSQDDDKPGCMHRLLRFSDLHQRLRTRKSLAYRSERNKSPKKKQNAVQDVSEDATQDASEDVTQDVSKNDAPVGGSPDDLGEDSKSAAVKTKHIFRGKISPNSIMRVLASKKMFRGKHKNRNTSREGVTRTLSIHHLSKDDFLAPDELTLEDENYEDAFSSDEGHFSSSNEALATETTESSSSIKQHRLYNSKSDRDGVGSQNVNSIIGLNEDDEGDYFSIRTSQVSSSGMHHQLSRSKNSSYREGQDHNGDHLVEKQPPVRKKLKEAEESSSMQIDEVVRELGIDATLFQSKECIEMLQLFSGNKELFLKFLHDPTLAQKQKASIPARELTKFCSFPGVKRSLSDDQNSQDHLQKETESTCKQEKNHQDRISSLVHNAIEDDEKPVESMAEKESNIHKAEISTLGSSDLFLEEQKDHNNVGIGSRHFKVLEKKIKEIIRADKMENQRISMDSVLHKVPYGEKLSQDEMNHPSVKHDKSVSKGNIWKPGMSSSSCKHTFKNIMRSSSLTESLGRYSQLLESVSITQPKKSLGMSKSVKYGMEVENRMPTRSLARILSLPALRTDSLRKYTRNDIPNCQFEMEPGSGLMDSTKYVDPGDHGQADLAAARSHDNESLESVELVEQPSSFNEQEQLEAFKDQHLSKAQERSYCNRNDASYGHEDILSLDMATSFDTVARTLQRHAEEPYSMRVPQTDSDIQTSCTEDNVEDIYDSPTRRGTRNFNSSHIQVDEREEAEFKYVRNILHKSGFSSQRALTEWHSPDQPVDPLLFDEEEECFYQDAKVAVDVPMTTLKHMLLFDLINEVLLETYDASFAYCPWVLHSDYPIRPLPVGHRVFEEVWAVISKHLRYQLLHDQTVEGIVNRDFKKNDGWMNLKHDIEYVGLDLGDFILEGLVDETVTDLMMTQ